jgi:hypothetical protein
VLARTLIAAVGATRLVRAWNYEVVGEAPREALLAKLSEPVVDDHGLVDVDATRRREWLKELAECPHCHGFWVTLTFVVAYRWRLARPLIEGLAGAMLLSWFVQWYPGFDFSEPDPPELRVLTSDEEGKNE